MPVRAPSKHRQILSVVKTLLQSINSTTSPLVWNTKPRTVSLGITVGDWTAGPRPAIYYEPAPWTMRDRSTQHERSFHIGVLCVCEGTASGIEQVLDLEEDVIFAFIRQPSSEYPALADGTRIQKFNVTEGDAEWDRRMKFGLATSLVTVEAVFVHGHTPATI